MIIRLINGYTIEPEPYNYTLRREYVHEKKDGTKETRTKVCGYYKDLKQSMESFLAHYQSDELADLRVDFTELVKLVEETNKKAVQALCAAIEGRNHEK